MHQDSTARETDKTSAKRLRFRLWTIASVLLVVVGGIWRLSPNPVLQPQVLILPLDYSIQSLPQPIPDRWIPMSWGWLWRLRYALLGRVPVIDVTSDFIRLTDVSPLDVAKMIAPDVPHAEANGIHAWILPDSALRALSNRLKKSDDSNVVGRPRMTSAHNIQANLQVTTTISIGNTQAPAGVFFNCLTLARGKSVELTAAITHSEPVAPSEITGAAAVLANTTRIHTNLNMSARLRMPPGFGAFLLDANRSDAAGRHIGIIVSSKMK